jgi:hypothetical protein
MNLRTALAILGSVSVVLVGIGAVPVHAQEEGVPVVSYALLADSTYQQGCFEPCDCPLLQEQPLEGTFDLVFYPFAGPLWRVAVERVSWRVPVPGHHITGSGNYVRAGETQSLGLSLSIDDGPATEFSSGWVEGGDRYPEIDLTVSMNGMYCYDVVLHLHAQPVDGASLTLAVEPEQLMWNAMPGDPTYDIVGGDLASLRESGEFSTATDRCLANDLSATTLAEGTAVDGGQGYWFLVREQGGSYDADLASQPTSRDPGLDAAGAGCP